MPGVLIDTDIVIDFLRGDAYAKPLMGGLWKDCQAIISVLTVYELSAGMRDAEKVVTHNFIEACGIEPITPEIAFMGGELWIFFFRTVNPTLWFHNVGYGFITQVSEPLRRFWNQDA